MTGVLVASFAFAAEPAVPPPLPPPTHAIVLSLDAYGEAVIGHVLVDADTLRSLKIEFKRGDVPVTGPAVPLVDGLRILGLPLGERLVAGGIDTMLHFDANGDQYLDRADPAFASLRLFVDANRDGKVAPSEVRTFTELGIDSISRYGSIRMKDR